MIRERTAYSLQDVFDALARSQGFEEVLECVLSVAVRELNADQGSLLLLQGGDNPSLKMLATVGMPEDMVRRGYVPRQGSISEYVLRERRPMIVNDLPRNENFESMAGDTSVRRNIFSAICVPLIAHGRVVGTLNLNRTKNRIRFDDSDLETGTLLGGQAAIVIENRRLQEELRTQQRLAEVGQTVAGISHCIKNLLSGVRGGLGVLEIGLAGEETGVIREGHGILKRSLDILQNLVLDLLDYSRERQPVREWFNIAELVEAVRDTVQFKAKTGRVALVVRPIQPDLRYRGDRDQIFRCLMNLAINAIEASAEATGDSRPPRVEISVQTLSGADTGLAPERARTAEEWVSLSVYDNGPGIAPEQQDMIWEPFHSTKGSKGTGIGLAVTRKMIREHGGDVILKSSRESGTLFRAILPAVTD